MSRPVVTPEAEELYAVLAPIADGTRIGTTSSDEALGWPLLIFCNAVTLRLHELNEAVRDDPLDATKQSWSRLFNPATCPVEWLPWVAQFVGVVFGSTSEAAMRADLAARASWQRGTPAAIIAGTQKFLTGTKSVVLFERWGSPVSADAPYQIAIRVKTTEATLGLADFKAEVQKLIPAGIVLDFAIITGQTWLQLRTTYATWTAVRGAYVTWAAVNS